MPLIGNTIRLKAEFKDFNGELTNIENPKVVVYDSKRKVILDAEPERIEKGKYQYDLIVPDYKEAGKQNEPLVFEFSGSLEDKPIVGRASFERMWSE